MRQLILACTVFALTPALSAAQSLWSVDLGAERSAVTVNRNHLVWEGVRLQASRVDAATGGWFAWVDRQRRAAAVDVALGASGYRRLGDWTIAGGVAAGIDPAFLYRRSTEAELSRRIIGPVVLSLAYRRLDFSSVDVDQVQTALTWSHPRGEVQSRLYLTRRGARDRSSSTGVISTWFDAHPRVRLSATAAYGDRIFDVASLASARALARAINLRGRFEVTTNNFIEVGGGAAHESPSFSQQTVSLLYRRTF